MKAVYSGWSVLALVLGASAMSACSSDPNGPSTTGGRPSEKGVAGGATTPTPGAPGAEGATDVSASASPAAPAVDATASMPLGAPPKLPSAPSTLLLGVVNGAVTDQGAGILSLGLGGQGTLAAAAKIRISQLLATGDLKLVADADIDASGKFSVNVPLSIDTLVAQAVDLTGHVLGSVIIGASGSVAGSVVVAAPITTETSLEVQVLLDAARCRVDESGHHGGLALAVDVSAIVDAKLTAAVAAAVSAGVDVDVLVHALAQAAVASVRARLQALVDAGITVDADAAVQADIDALLHLNAGLADVLAGKVTPVQVTARLLADLDAALSATANVSASVRARAQVAASLTFCATLAASLVGVAHVDAVVFAATHAAAQIEAQITATAVADIVKLAGGAQAAIDAVVAAGAKLVADVGAATNIKLLQQARLDFLTTLCGGVNGAGGLLGDLLVQTTGSVNALLGSVLDAVAKLAADLDASLKADLSAIVKADVCVDVDASAKLDVSLHALIDTLAKFGADVQALGPSLAAGTTAQVSAKALADILATAQILLRVAI